MKVYLLVYHDPWDLSEPGPEDVSIEGVFTSYAAAEKAGHMNDVEGRVTPILESDRVYGDEDEDDDEDPTSPYYTIREFEVSA